ncbi:MAG TPA: hypothetical protein VKT77_03010 [Chthonomonadaceae bacterium]|nr:hypothetical protein [Chthonomonadaceae bacterium]
MPGKRNRAGVDEEIDLHHHTAEDARRRLHQEWPRWRKLQAVRIVDGRGPVLRPLMERWCADRGIAWLQEPDNPGAIRILPQQRSLPSAELSNTLADRGLRLTAEEAAELRDPARAAREREEERRRQVEQARREQNARAAEAARQRSDAALFDAEMRRLGVGKSRGRAETDAKPKAPIIVPKLEVKIEEGYWSAELSRVAETDTQTLQVQKRTGLDKLAPPMKEPPSPPPAGQPPPNRPAQRDTAEDAALFEAELERLSQTGPAEARRKKRE